jgi:hypothetical protein
VTKRSSARKARKAPAKKVMNPIPGSWKEPNPYFRDEQAIAIPTQSQTRLEN